MTTGRCSTTVAATRGTRVLAMRRAPRANPYRDTWAGDLDAGQAGSISTVAGWVNTRRDHGGLIFVDLRDRSGIVQLVFHPENGAELFAAAERLRAEYVVSVEGAVVLRESGQVNPNLATGEIEIQVAEMQLLAESQTPPFPLDGDGELDEMLRLRNRTLDLRRRPMVDALVLRHEIVRCMRETLSEEDFLEIETPILTRSTPEGARDFLVPSRLQPGNVLRAAAVAAALQAAADGRRLRALLPDRALLSRRGPARRPPAGVHAARPRDVVRRGGRRHRRQRAPDGEGLRARRARHPAAAVRADGLRRGDAALRHRPPRPALRLGDQRRLRAPPRIGVQGVRVGDQSVRPGSCARSTPVRARSRARSSTS